jgi:acyl-CoA thioesterase FadM
VGVSKGEQALAADGYAYADPVLPRADDFDHQGHLNNASIVRLFNDMRVEYVHGRIGAWWPQEIRAQGYVIAAKELHVSYDSEGFPGESFVGAMRYVYREGKAAVLEQRIVEEHTGRAVARAWVVQLLVQDGVVVEWPARYFDAVAGIEGRDLEVRSRRSTRSFGPPE